MIRIVGRALKLLGILWFGWRLFGPDPVPRTVGAQRRPLQVPGRSVFVGRHEFFVREAGDQDAPPIVLVHGWNFDSEMAFHKLVPILAERYRVIFPDLRNHGKSDRIRGSFEISDVADEVDGIIRELDIETPVPILGYSMGGMVVQELAIRHPETPLTVILAATSARPFHRLRPLGWFLFRVTRAIARISRVEAVWASFSALRRHGLIGAEDEAWMWDSLLARDANLYHEAMYAMWRFDARERVTSIVVPALVVIPERDTVVRVDTQEELASLLPDVQVARLPAVGHEAVLADASNLAEAVISYLDSIGYGASS